MPQPVDITDKLSQHTIRKQPALRERGVAAKMPSERRLKFDGFASMVLASLFVALLCQLALLLVMG